MDRKEYNREYYKKHKRKRIAQQLAYYYRNEEKRKTYQKEHYRKKRQSVTDNCDNVSEETDSDNMTGNKSFDL